METETILNIIRTISECHTGGSIVLRKDEIEINVFQRIEYQEKPFEDGEGI